MLEALRRILSPEYLIVSAPGPIGGLWPLYVALGLFFGLGLVVAFLFLVGPGHRKRAGIQRAFAWYELWICLAGLGTIMGRFLGWPGWSARIWPYSLALLAIAGVLAYLLRSVNLSSRLVSQLGVLALTCPPPREQEEGLKVRALATLLLSIGVHLAGIGLVLSIRYGWPLWTTPLVLLVLLLPQAPLVARRRLPRLMALTPLLGAYAATILWLFYDWQGITVIEWQGLAFPNPMVSLFYIDGIALASAAYAMLCQLFVTSSFLGKPSLFWRWTAIVLLVATLAWAGWVYFGKRTHGATASDPYAYAQMAVDLADHGTFLHRLSLFEQVMPLEIAWAPLQPVGYHIPRNELGDSPSVWATGASALLAAGYLVFGETGLYVTTPAIALLALAATWALVHEALPQSPRSIRYLAAALAIALTATSPEHVDRLLVPMADAPAQLFTVLTLFFALRGMHQLQRRRRGILAFVLAGLCFSWAYWVRHTQLVLALPIILAIVTGNRSKSHFSGSPASDRWSWYVWPSVAFLGAALLAALPDIIYRWRVFGGPLATETTELHLMRVQYIGAVAWQMLRDTLAAGEWGYLFPFAIYGVYQLAKKRHGEAVVLGSAFFAVLVVHVTYRSLRLRDLLSLFPLVNLAVAFGAVSMVHHARTFARRNSKAPKLGEALLPIIIISWTLVSLALARWAMIDNIWKRGWASFGYMRFENRAAFDRLTELTPPQSIIGASLNAGAIMMYTGRDAIRPYDSWTDGEWEVFVDTMLSNDRPIYLLDDGGLMAHFIERERERSRLAPVESLKVPLFYTQDRDSGWLYRLERE
jgi:hypothetical protein